MNLVKAKISGSYPNYNAEIIEEGGDFTIQVYPISNMNDILFLRNIDSDSLEMLGWVEWGNVPLPKKTNLKTEQQAHSKKYYFRISQLAFNGYKPDLSSPQEPSVKSYSFKEEGKDTDQKGHQFFVELTCLINRYSVDSKANTPDYVLAEYMIDCLKTFCSSLKNRMAHIYGNANKSNQLK